MPVTPTPFVGSTYTVVHGTYTLQGIRDVKLVQKGGPAPEAKDITASQVAVYTYIPDPLGSKGAGTVTLTVTCEDSTISYGTDNAAHKVPLNTPVNLTTVDWQPLTVNANQWSHTSLELTGRVTDIPYDALATVTLTFEGNGVGTWDSPT
jgi:hypothetical protein